MFKVSAVCCIHVGPILKIALRPLYCSYRLSYEEEKKYIGRSLAV